jgi:hypothetical protein
MVAPAGYPACSCRPPSNPLCAAKSQPGALSLGAPNGELARSTVVTSSHGRLQPH